MAFSRAGDSEATPSGHPHHLLLYSCLGSVGSCLWPHRSSQCPQVVAAWVLASELSSCLQEPQTLEPPRASGWLSFLRTQDACFLQNVRAEKDPFGRVPSSEMEKLRPREVGRLHQATWASGGARTHPLLGLLVTCSSWSSSPSG